MQYMSLEHLKFLLFEVHNVQDLLQYDHFSHLDKDAIDMMVQSAKDLADRDMFPYLKEMDEQYVRYAPKESTDGITGMVRTHPQIKNIIQNVAEAGWIGGGDTFENGGLQLPAMIFNAAQHIFQAANNSAQGYLGLSAGAAHLITAFGSRELINAYVPHIYEGRWQGTMALTEPQAGSSLSDIVTSASPIENGTYKIKGQKIFISGGDHLACDNFVHLTLARIEGAPAGTKGISLFVVPKFRIDKEGNLAYNDVFTAGDFQKMGQRGYATTHLVFGDNNDCFGYLVGQPHKGLTYMFQMMNEARIGVGQTAASVSMAAYYASLQYANERPQGRLLTNKIPNAAPTLIINHADIQRMLLLQKAICEGGMSLAMECNRLADIANHHETGEIKTNTHLLLEILTPIIKTYASEQGNRSTSMGVQILGGYGYTTDFILQQYYRDLRIMSLYEGTTGIQSLDLLGRKMTMENGKAYQLLAAEMQATAKAAMKYDNLKPYSKSLKKEITRLEKVLKHLIGFAMTGRNDLFLADATIFMEMAGTIVVGWQWLKQALIAQAYLANSNGSQSNVFYESKIHTMRFFFKYEMSHSAACADTLLNKEVLTDLKENERMMFV
jgi:alkylation response protein AidB-like acyl-CoA dehydrogenase